MTKNSFKYTVSKKEKKKTTQQTPIITQSQTFHAVDFFFFLKAPYATVRSAWSYVDGCGVAEAREVWTMPEKSGRWSSSLLLGSIELAEAMPAT